MKTKDMEILFDEKKKDYILNEARRFLNENKNKKEPESKFMFDSGMGLHGLEKLVKYLSDNSGQLPIKRLKTSHATYGILFKKRVLDHIIIEHDDGTIKKINRYEPMAFAFEARKEEI